MFGIMHLGFADRPDIADAPIQTCPARSIDNSTIEWTLLFGDAEYGAQISREEWCPAWRDIHRSLRVEKRLIEQSVRKSKE